MRKNKDKQFVHMLFCAPTGTFEGKPFPNRLTDEVFETLAKAGINRIMDGACDGRKETIEKTFELCEKYGMLYYPIPECAGEYRRVVPGENGEKPFADLSEKEKEALDKRFINELKEMKTHSSFGGIFLCDEAGYLSFDGIAHAKEVFDEYMGDYEFHNNMLSYSINEGNFWGGINPVIPENPPFKLEGDMEIKFENRFTYYDKFIEGILSKTSLEFISQDRYPFHLSWPSVPTSVHVALFELNAFFNEKKKKYGSMFYNYMQVGQWDPGRDVTFAEMALQMHVTAAYGSEGFGYFPGCFPPNWAEVESMAPQAEGAAGLIDINGNKTKYCDWITTLNVFFKAIENDILSSDLLGVTGYGEYDNGFRRQEIVDLPDSECIYCGDIPDILRYDSGIEVESSNQVLISTFVRDDKKRYYVVNLSTVKNNIIKLRLPKSTYSMIAVEGTRNIECDTCIVLEAGCGVYIIES